MVLKDGSKMSKSKGNTVDPQELIEQYGADTVRLFIMFAAPPEQSLEWSDSAVEGAHRFLKRLWKMVHTHINAGTPGKFDAAALSEAEKDLRRKTHETIAKVGNDFGKRLTFNTAIAALMELSNEIGKVADRGGNMLAVEREALETTVLLLSPIVPHISHALWSALGHSDAVIDARWPQVDDSALVRDSIELPVQVNGKLRGRIVVAANADNDSIIALAKAEPHVQKFLEGKTIKMCKVVPGKLVTFAVSE
jgi:leucyl-tRNA synthetase